MTAFQKLIFLSWRFPKERLEGRILDSPRKAGDSGSLSAFNVLMSVEQEHFTVQLSMLPPPCQLSCPRRDCIPAGLKQDSSLTGLSDLPAPHPCLWARGQVSVAPPEDTN